MATILSQSMDGSWKLTKIKHDKAGLTITGSSVTYKGKKLNLPPIKNTETTLQTNTGWVTRVGMSDSEIRAMENEINDSFKPSPYPAGNVSYTVIADFRCIPYTPVEPTHEYRLRIDPEESIIESDGVTALTTYFVTDNVLPGRVVTTLSNWSIVEGGDHAFIGNTTTKKGSVTGNNQTNEIQPVRVKATYEFEGETYEAYAIVRVKPVETPEPPAPEIKVSDISILFDCEDNDLFPITVTASVPWSVTVSRDAQSWLSIQDITAAGFKVKVTDNHVEDRTGYISVASVGLDEGIGVDITVTQPFCDDTPVPTFNVDTTPITALCSSNEPYWVSVTAENTDWEVEVTVGGEWISIANKANNGFNVIVSDNTGAERDGTIRVAPTAEGLAPKTIAVSQPDCTPVPDSITINPDSWTIPCDVSDDTRYHFNITANVEWGFEGDVETTYDWIHIVETGETYFELKFEKNDAPDADERHAYINITGGTARATVSILQEKCEDIPPVQETINITTNDFELPCETDETYTISVDASTGWTAATIYEWINIAAITSDSIEITVSDNPGGDRDGIISAYTIEGGTMALDTITITQLECEIENNIAADVDSLDFECPGDSAIIHIFTTGDSVTWTATTNDNWIEITNPSSTEITVAVTGENRTRRNKQGTVTITSNISGKDPIEVAIIQKPTMFFYVIPDRLRFNSDGETITVDVQTNYAFSVSVPTTASSWLSATVSQNTGNNTAWTVSFTALANSDTANPRTTVVTFATNYDGECEWGNMPFVTIEQDKAEPYIPPTPDAYFDVTELYGDFPYGAELGGYTHERSFVDESFYDCCSDFTKGDIGGVAYLMPLRACALQVYYDTNVDITGLTYEIEHISPANPSQEWLEVYLNPEEYGYDGWSEVDSNGDPYPGDFILIKTRDRFDGTDLYEDTYTGYVHIKEKATGNILRTIPVKCIPGDYNAERVSASETETGTLKKRNLELSTTVPASGGTVDVWVYANDSAYISDHPDDDISWNRLSFYYDDGETKIPVTPNDDPQGYIDKIYDTTCNQNGRFHLVVKVGANTLYSNVTRGFELSSENSGYEFIDTDSYCRIKINQERDRIISENNYRIEEFYYVSGDMMPVYDGEGYEASNITGGTCGGNGFTMRPHVSILCDVRRASSPNRITIQEVTNDNRIIFDENKQHYIVNPDVLQSAVTYENGSNWIEVNANYNAQQDTPFEFYIKPNTGYSSVGEARTAIITLTYNRAAQSPRQFRITQEYKQVEQVKVNMLMYSGGSPSVSYVENATGMVDSNGYIIINNQMNQYIHIEGEENVIFTVVPSNSTACTFERIVGSYHRPDGGDSSEIDFYTAYQIDGNGCDLYFNDDAGYGVTYTISINCAKDGRVSRTLTIVVIR